MKSDKVLILITVVLFAVSFQACYSSTAVKGIPVNDLNILKDDRIAKRKMQQAEREELSEMSKIKENKVFLEKDGFSEYRIGPLDVLEISSHVGDKVTTTMVTVNNRGKISYSFLDDQVVEGLTPSKFDATLTKNMAKYIRNPRIDILVKEFNSKYALVLGELTSIRGDTYSNRGASGKIYLKGKTTLMDLIALAGGYTVDADIKNVKLIRGKKRYQINLYDIIEKGNESLNVVINDEDVVDVPELPEYGERVYVMGEVIKQGVYSLKDAQDLLAAIALAGSFTSLAKEEHTLVVREYEPGKKPLVIAADLKALLREADLSQNVRLKNGDLVYVPRMLIGDINDWITNMMPLLDLLLYPSEFEDAYFLRHYLHFDRRHDTMDKYHWQR